MTLTIQAGKYYRTRDGRKVGPIEPLVHNAKAASACGSWNLDRPLSSSDTYPFHFESETYTKAGRVLDGREESGDLIAEWTEPMAAPHIITSANGRTYDLTALETPFGLLPEAVKDALLAWPHGWEYFSIGGLWESPASGFPAWYNHQSYRAKPAPKVTEIKFLAYFCGPFLPYIAAKMSNPTHKITIRHTGNTLPYGTYKLEGTDAAFIVEKAE
jgi:hypothetical protein